MTERKGIRVDLIFPDREVCERYYKSLIYLSCRTCYSEKSPSEIWADIRAGKVPEEKMEKLIESVVASGHGTTIEHINFTFAISGVSRTLTHQLVRHRHASFDQQSQRYVKFKHPDFTLPQSVQDDPTISEAFKQQVEANFELYEEMLRKVPAEDARFLFPNAVNTNLIMTTNLRELIHMSGLRLCTLAQWEIRALFKGIRREMMNVSPFFGKMLTPHCVHEGYCNEYNNRDGHCRIRPPKEQVLRIWEKYRRGELIEAAGASIQRFPGRLQEGESSPDQEGMLEKK